MTRKEFTSKFETLRRIQGWYIFVLQGLVFGVLLTPVVFAPYLRQHFTREQWDSIGGWVLSAIAFPGFIGLICGGTYLARKWGLVCKNCRKTLIEKYGRIARLTGECPKCRAKIFDEIPAADSATAKTLDREEFKAKFEVLNRRQFRRSLIRLGVLAGATIVGGIVVRRVVDMVNQGKLDWMTVEWRRWALVIVLAGSLLPWQSLFLLLALGKLEPRGLPCPECGHSLLGKSGKVAFESGICIYCGCRPFGVAPLEGNGNGSGERSPATAGRMPAVH